MVDSLARAIPKRREISHLENDQAEAADTVGGLDCQEDAGVGGEESSEDGYPQLEVVLGLSEVSDGGNEGVLQGTYTFVAFRSRYRIFQSQGW